MKRIVFGLLALTALVFVGCENDGGGNSSKFEGEWAFVADYDDEYGWDYYYGESDTYIKISGNSIAIYEANDWDGYSFGNGYYECSRDDFEYIISTTFNVSGGKGYLDGIGEAGYLEISDGKLYRYYTEDEDGYCEMYERVKGFKED